MVALVQEVSSPEFVATTQPRREVLERYEGKAVDVAVALVRDPANPDRAKLEVHCPPDVRLAQDVEELLFRALALTRQVQLTLGTGQDRALCLNMIYGVIAGLFVEVDRAAVRGDVDCARITYLETACDRAERYFQRASQRRAQLRYLGGMLGGLSVIAVMGVLLSLGLAMMPDISDQAPLFVATFVAGGTGAIMSVLFAMTSGHLRLHTLFANAESTRAPLVAAGALRPLLGALSGTMVYVLLQSSLVPLKVPDGAAETHFYIALAIVAGFSERWARGVLAGTEERIQAGAKKA
ncbi:MAG TPA: hypothetical protein VFZ00_06320 [Solirubrobacter sp.]|nr:hypothetical protein [Solirubrobacter sp.]